MKNIFDKNKFINKVYEYQQGIENYIGLVDYTMLSTESKTEDIIGLCERAKHYGVSTVCVRPNMVAIAKKELKDSDVGVTTVVSFPDGTNSLTEKKSECAKALSDGADDVDMVLDYQRLINTYSNVSGDYDNLDNVLDPDVYLLEEVNALSTMCHDAGRILKVIVESGRLNNKMTKVVTEICIDGEADFIKTSTGMVEVGAEESKLKIFYDTIRERKSDMKIKASGGIRTFEDIKKFAPYTDRFGIGSTSIDTMMGNEQDLNSEY